MSEFTPGPWYVHPKWRHVCANGDHDCVVSMSPPWMMKYERASDEDLANLVLIAAAPTMHASLQEIQEFTRDAPDDHPLSYVYALACAGLAKSRVGIAQASAGDGS